MDILTRAEQSRRYPRLSSTWHQIATGGRLAPGSPEEDFFQEAAASAPRLLGGRELFVPLSALASRAMSTQPGGKGGYLVSPQTGDTTELLRPWSMTVRAGITILPDLKDPLILPRVTSGPTPYWLADGEAATPSDPGIGAVSMIPKTVLALTAFSRQLGASPAADFTLKRELRRTIGAAIDLAVLAGTGGAQPLGVLNTPGIGTTTGTSLAQAGVTEMKRKVSDADCDDDGISFLAPPAVRELLEKRERSTGSGFIWDDDKVASRPAYASTQIPASTMICGYCPSVFLAIFGGGLIFEVDQSTFFNSAGLVARVMADVDVALTLPGAFTKASSIT